MLVHWPPSQMSGFSSHSSMSKRYGRHGNVIGEQWTTDKYLSYCNVLFVFLPPVIWCMDLILTLSYQCRDITAMDYMISICWYFSLMTNYLSFHNLHTRNSNPIFPVGSAEVKPSHKNRALVNTDVPQRSSSREVHMAIRPGADFWCLLPAQVRRSGMRA